MEKETKKFIPSYVAALIFDGQRSLIVPIPIKPSAMHLGGFIWVVLSGSLVTVVESKQLKDVACSYAKGIGFTWLGQTISPQSLKGRGALMEIFKSLPRKEGKTAEIALPSSEDVNALENTWEDWINEKTGDDITKDEIRRIFRKIASYL